MDSGLAGARHSLARLGALCAQGSGCSSPLVAPHGVGESLWPGQDTSGTGAVLGLAGHRLEPLWHCPVGSGPGPRGTTP